jgi:sialate O-acetylesterase
VPALSNLNVAVQLGDPRSTAHKRKLELFLDETSNWLTCASAVLNESTLVSPMPAYPQELLPPDGYQNPTALYNGMIYSLHPFAIHGAIWYQGESNLGDGMSYAGKMNALVCGWREIWGEGAFPFYFVQIAPFNYSTISWVHCTPIDLAEIWEAQSTAK